MRFATVPRSAAANPIHEDTRKMAVTDISLNAQLAAFERISFARRGVFLRKPKIGQYAVNFLLLFLTFRFAIS